MTSLNNEKCNLCGSRSRDLLTTLYGVNICVQCDSDIRKYSISDLEGFDISRLDAEINSYKESVKRKSYNKQFYYTFRDEFRTIRIPIDYEVKDPPRSKTLERIKAKALTISLVVSLIVLIIALFYLSFFLSVLVSLFIAVVLNKIYLSILKRIHVPAIDNELKQSQAEIDRRNRELESNRQQRLEQYAQWKVSHEYPQKYIRFASKIQKFDPPLYEYYLYEYPPDWQERAEAIKKRDRYRCTNCGHTADLAVHHKKPVRRGGDHFPQNLITLCNQCHLDEHPSLKAKITQDLFLRQLAK